MLRVCYAQGCGQVSNGWAVDACGGSTAVSPAPLKDKRGKACRVRSCHPFARAGHPTKHPAKNEEQSNIYKVLGVAEAPHIKADTFTISLQLPGSETQGSIYIHMQNVLEAPTTSL